METVSCISLCNLPSCLYFVPTSCHIWFYIQYYYRRFPWPSFLMRKFKFHRSVLTILLTATWHQENKAINWAVYSQYKRKSRCMASVCLSPLWRVTHGLLTHWCQSIWATCKDSFVRVFIFVWTCMKGFILWLNKLHTFFNLSCKCYQSLKKWVFFFPNQWSWRIFIFILFFCCVHFLYCTIAALQISWLSCRDLWCYLYHRPGCLSTRRHFFTRWISHLEMKLLFC